MPDSVRDYYEVLDVAKDASPADIKRAFLKKARVLHPDVCDAPDAEERFKELNEAYSVLSDPRRRENYDRFGDPNGVGSFDMGDFFSGFDMADLMSEFFGTGRQSQRRARRGRDMAARLSVSLAEAATGTTRTIAYDRLAVCDDCHGTGSQDGAPATSCPECGGSGYKVRVQRTILGTMQTNVPCPSCGGSGQVIEHPCETCDGQGRTPTHEVVEIHVPRGVRTGETIRRSALGEAGTQGSGVGDLVVEILVENDPRFRRVGDDLVGFVTLDAIDAILGAEVEMEGILEDERFYVKVPKDALEGDEIRVSGHGMPLRSGDSRGDFVGVVHVVAAKRLSKNDRMRLRSMRASHSRAAHFKKNARNDTL